MIEGDVGQQRRDDASLRSANRRRLENTVFDHACAKELLDETQDVAVGDLSRDCFHKDRMGKIIEKSFDVG